MADEITAQMELKYDDGNAKDSLSFHLTIDMTGTDFAHGVKTITNSETTINDGDVATPGWIALKNLGDTTTVNVYMATGGDASIHVAPGHVAVFRVSPETGSVIYADTTGSGSSDLEYLLIED